MTKISMTELYDDRTVIKQISKLTDQNNATAVIANDAKESADVSAQSASASATAAASSASSALEAKTYAQGLDTKISNAETSAKNAETSADTAVKASAQAVTTANVAKSATDDMDDRVTNLEAYSIKGNLGASSQQTMQGGLTADEFSADLIYALTEAVVHNLIVSGYLDASTADRATVPDTAVTDTSQTAVNSKRLSEQLKGYVDRTSAQEIAGRKTFTGSRSIIHDYQISPTTIPESFTFRGDSSWNIGEGLIYSTIREAESPIGSYLYIEKKLYNRMGTTSKGCALIIRFDHQTGIGQLSFEDTKGKSTTLIRWEDSDLIDKEESS